MSDVMHVAEYALPEYILPDDPPDSKPDLNILKKMKDEPNHSPSSYFSASSDDPPDSKPDLNILKENKDESDHLTSSSSTSPDNSQRDPFEAIKEEPTAGLRGSAAAPGLERVKLDVSEAEAEEAARRDDELGLVETALGRTLRPVLRRCDEVLSRPDGVQVSAITAEQRRRLGRVDTAPRVEIVTDFVKLEVVKHELEDDPAWTISEIRDSHTFTNKSPKTGGKPAEKCIKKCPGDRVPRLRTARRTSISVVKTRLRSAGDMRTRCHGQQGKSQSDGLPGGPTPPAQRTVSAEGDTPCDRGRPTLSNPTSGIAGQPPSFMRPPPAPPVPRPARPKRPRAASADSGDDWSPSRYVRAAQRRACSTGRRSAAKGKSKFQPPVKKTTTETGATPAERPPPAEAAAAGDLFKMDKAQQPQEEEEARRRPPSPPYNFLGFTLEDQYKARYAVDTKAELLWNHIIAGFKAMGEAPPEREVFKRRRTKVNYQEEEDLDDDDYIFCDECDREWEGDCPTHGPLVVIPDTKVPFGTGDPERDIKTRPEFLNPGRSKIPDANTGIWTEKDLPARQRFGPYEGTITPDRRQATSSGYSWEIKKCRRVHHYVDAGDTSCSNWLRLVNCARFEHEQNLVAFQYKGQMYYRTYKAIPKGSELLVYYGDAYARELNINVQTFRRKAPPAPPPSAAFSGGAMIRCVHCDYACLGQDHLDKHVKRRHGHIGRDGRHKCEWCEYSTDCAAHLRRHRVTHTGERRHRCDDCGKTFTELGHLTAHRRVHSGQKPYRCDVCGKAFSYSGNLRTHTRVHSGMTVRQCDQCGATFNQASSYNTHMMSHYGVKAYRCQVCSARFVTRAELTRHMRTHTGERPYSCSFCAARFSDQGHMKKHVTALHTHDFRHRCGRCGKGFIQPSRLKKHVDKCSVAN